MLKFKRCLGFLMHEIFFGKSNASNLIKEITTRFSEFENGKWKEQQSDKFTDRFEKFEPENYFKELFEK